MSDLTSRVDPIAPDPAGRPARHASPRSRPPCVPGPRCVPEVGIVLGSGLGGLADDLVDPVAIPFDGAARLAGGDRAGSRRPAAPGRASAAGRVVMLQGRFHLYEGNDPGLVIQPVLLFRRLGARIVVLTNAAGGLDPTFGPGTLMVMRDHINLTGRSPLIGPNADELGPRFPDLTEAWSPAPAGAPARGRGGRGRRPRRGRLRRADRPDLRDPGRGPDAGVARRPCGRDVHRARMHRRALGRPRGLRRVARDERRRRATPASR